MGGKVYDAEDPPVDTGGMPSVPGPGPPGPGSVKLRSLIRSDMEGVLLGMGKNVEHKPSPVGEGTNFTVGNMGRLNKTIGPYEATVMHDQEFGSPRGAMGPDFGMGYEMFEHPYQPEELQPELEKQKLSSKSANDPFAGKGGM